MTTFVRPRGALGGQLALAFLLIALGRPAVTQCQLEWQSGAQAPGIFGNVTVLAHAANGDLIAAGQFQAVGSAVAANIARYDGVTWRALGVGTSGAIHAISILPNGDIVVGGVFQTIGGVPANNVARWNGTAWSPLGSGVDGPVRDVAVLPNGSLVVVGDFANAGAVAAAKVAVFDGTAWSARGAGPSVYSVLAVTVLPGGDIVVGGDSFPGTNDVERWNGSSWQALAGVTTSQLTGVLDLRALPNGSLAIAANVNVTPGFLLGIWNGTQLVAQAAPFAELNQLLLAPNGELVGVGAAGGVGTVARFDGVAWSPVGPSIPGRFRTVAFAPGGSAVGVITAPPSPVVNIAQLLGGSWAPLLTAPELAVGPLQALPDGDFVVGGEFTTIGGVAAANIARFDGAAWHALGQGVDGVVRSLASGPGGSLVVGGEFLSAGGSPVQRIARWSGSSWSSLGAGLAFVPHVLAVGDDGSVLALGADTAARFDGSAWQPIQLPQGAGLAAAALPGSGFLIGGSFLDVGGPSLIVGMLRVTGNAAVVEPGFGNQAIHALLRVADGAVVASRLTGGSSELLRLDGASVQTISPAQPGALQHLQQLPDGDLVVTRRISQSRSAVLRLDGSVWSTQLDDVGTAGVIDLAVSSRGELAVSGGFVVVGGQVSFAFARAMTNCPAGVTSFGAGCVGSAGSVELRTADRPWLGSTMRQTATGMAPLSLAVHVVGLGTAVVPLPLAAPGCFGLVAPVATELLSPQGATVQAPLAIPSLPPLIGLGVFTQVIGIEFDATPSWIRTTASNALQLTVGAF